MKHRFGQIVAVCVAVAVAGPVLGAARKSAVTKRPSRQSILRAKLQSVYRQIRFFRSQLHETKQQEARISDLLQESQDRLERATRQLRLAKQKERAAKQQVEAATRRLRAAEQRLALHQRRLSRRIAANYMMGTVSYADVLLGSESVAEFLDRQYLVEKVLDSDMVLLRELRAAQERVEQERAVLEQKRVRLAEARQAIGQKLLEVQAEQERRAKLLAQVQNEREWQERMLDELEEDSQAITARLQAEEARRRLLYRVPRGVPLRWSGRFSRPAGGRITSGFGYRMHPILGYRRFHCGIDIGAGHGAPVYAAAEGEIFEAGFYRGYGRCIIILHGGGFSTLYGHLSAALVRPGQRVKRGQRIGRVGSTGLATGPHLHFEVRRDGVPVNPALWTGR